MRRAARDRGPRLLAASLALWLGAGCAWIPEAWLDDPEPRQDTAPVVPPPLEDCSVLTILVNTSRSGDPEIAERARRAMSGELRRFGATITDSPQGAFWSLMILGTQNARRDGFILNALLTARSGTESGGPGMTVFAKKPRDAADEPVPEVNAGGDAAETEGGKPEPAREPDEARGVPTLYSGIAFGPHAQLDRQARELSRQAYAAVYPAARRMCEYDASERDRERELEAQLPPPPEPL